MIRIGILIVVILIFGGFLMIAGGFAWRASTSDPDNPSLADTTVATIAGVTVKLDRYAIHPVLAEYKRIVTVTPTGGKPLVTELEPDSGGMDRLAVCETTAGRIVMADRADTYELMDDGALRKLNTSTIRQVLPDGSTVSILEPEPSPACARHLGAFEKTAGGGYGFVPAQQ